MKYTFTAVFKREGNKVFARVPDLDGCITSGKSIEDAIDQMTDAMQYRAKTNTKTVRKNVSLPAFLFNFAEKRHINCSQVLQDALMAMF